jgi:hypothetical protein
VKSLSFTCGGRPKGIMVKNCKAIRRLFNFEGSFLCPSKITTFFYFKSGFNFNKKTPPLLYAKKDHSMKTDRSSGSGTTYFPTFPEQKVPVAFGVSFPITAAQLPGIFTRFPYSAFFFLTIFSRFN